MFNTPPRHRGILWNFLQAKVREAPADENALSVLVDGDLFAKTVDPMTLGLEKVSDKGSFFQSRLLNPLLDELFRSSKDWNGYDRKTLGDVVFGPLNFFLAGQQVFDNQTTSIKNTIFFNSVLDIFLSNFVSSKINTNSIVLAVRKLVDDVKAADADVAKVRPTKYTELYRDLKPYNSWFAALLVSNDTATDELIEKLGVIECREFILRILYHLELESKVSGSGYRQAVINKAVPIFAAKINDDSISDEVLTRALTAIYITHIEVPELMLSLDYRKEHLALPARSPFRLNLVQTPLRRSFGTVLSNTSLVSDMVLLFASQKPSSFTGMDALLMSGESRDPWLNVSESRPVTESVFDILSHQMTMPIVRQIADINAAGLYPVYLPFYPQGLPANPGYSYDRVIRTGEEDQVSVPVQHVLKGLIFGIWLRFYASNPDGLKMRNWINQTARLQPEKIEPTAKGLSWFFPDVIFPDFIRERYVEAVSAAASSSAVWANPPPPSIPSEEGGGGEAQKPPIVIDLSGGLEQASKEEKLQEVVEEPEKKEEESDDEEMDIPDDEDGDIDIPQEEDDEMWQGGGEGLPGDDDEEEAKRKQQEEEEKKKKKKEEESKKKEAEKKKKKEEQKKKEEAQEGEGLPGGQTFSFLFRSPLNDKSVVDLAGKDQESFFERALRPLYQSGSSKPDMSDEALAIFLRNVLQFGFSAQLDQLVTLQVPASIRSWMDKLTGIEKTFESSFKESDIEKVPEAARLKVSFDRDNIRMELNGKVTNIKISEVKGLAAVGSGYAIALALLFIVSEAMPKSATTRQAALGQIPAKLTSGLTAGRFLSTSGFLLPATEAKNLTAIVDVLRASVTAVCVSAGAIVSADYLNALRVIPTYRFASLAKKK